jgi:hypothetical protein
MTLTKARLEALKAIALQCPRLAAFCDINGIDIDEAIVSISRTLHGLDSTHIEDEKLIELWLEDELHG